MVTTSFVEDLAQLEAGGKLRSLRTVRPLGPVEGEWQGERVILFSTNDYLGLRFHPRVSQRVAETLKDAGWGAGASRLLSGTTPWHAQLEEELARFTGRERALVFATGFMANLGALGAVAGKGDRIVLDKLCHASLIDGSRLSGAEVRVFAHRNLERARELLEGAGPAGRKLLVTDSVFSMDGDLAPLESLLALARRHGAQLLVDEAHAIGVFGARGSGLAESLELERDVDFYVGTLSKALGGLGGFVAGSKDAIAWLVNRARSFIFATALPAAACAGALAALEVLGREPERRERLWQNARFLKSAFAREGWGSDESPTPILPLVVGEESRALALAGFLLEQGLFIPAIRPPTVPPGTSRLRISVTCEHTAGQLERLIECLKDARRRGLWGAP